MARPVPPPGFTLDSPGGTPAPPPGFTLDDDGSPLELGNIDLTNRPRVKNPDGSISTVRSTSFNFDGNEVLLPTVTDDGRVLDENTPAGRQEIVDTYRRTGKHLGKFASIDAANAYAEKLHNDQAAMLEQPPAPPDGFTLDAPSLDTGVDPELYAAATPFGRQVYDVTSQPSNFDHDWLRSQLGAAAAPEPRPGFTLDSPTSPAAPPRPGAQPYEPTLGDTLFGRDDPNGAGNVVGILPSLAESFKAPDWSRLLENTRTQVGADLTAQLTGSKAMLEEGAATASEGLGRDTHHGGFQGHQYRDQDPIARARGFREDAAENLAIAREASAGADEAQAPDAGVIERTLQGGASSALESAAGLVTGGPLGAAAVLGAGQGGSRYAELRNKGESTQSAAKSAALTAGLEGLTEYLPGEALFEKVPGFKARLVKFLASEVPGEEATSLGELVDDYEHGLRDDITASDVAAVMSDTALQTITGGAIQAGGAHVAQNPHIVAEGLKALSAATRAAPKAGAEADLGTATDAPEVNMTPGDEPAEGVEAQRAPTEPKGNWQADPSAAEGEPFAHLGDPEAPEASLLERDGKIVAVNARTGDEIGTFDTPDEAAIATEQALEAPPDVDELGASTDPSAEEGASRQAPVSMPEGANLRNSASFPELGQATEPAASLNGLGDAIGTPAATQVPPETSSGQGAASAKPLPDSGLPAVGALPGMEQGEPPSPTLSPRQDAQHPQQGVPRGAPVTPAAPDKRTGERRSKKRVAEMSPEDLRRELLTHELTGIPNRRAYEEAPKLAHQTAIDVDSLKWVNDNMGHESGNHLLQAVADALRDETGDAYHISGDEFALQSKTPEEAAAIMQRVSDRLAGAVVSVTMPDGKVVTLSGMGVSFGTGTDLTQADAALQAHKTHREQTGQRSARGHAPAGASAVAAEDGREGDEGHAAAEGTAREGAGAEGAPLGDATREAGRAEPVTRGERITLTGNGHVSGSADVEDVELHEHDTTELDQVRAEQRARGEEGDAYDELDGQVEGEYQARAGGLKEAIQKMLGGAKNSPRITFVDGMRGIPRTARARIHITPGHELSGGYDPTNDRVYINVAALESLEHGVFVAAHEIAGHLGLRGFVGRGEPGARKKLDAALKIAAQNPYVDGLAEAIRIKRTKLSRLQSVEEALAEIAATMRTGRYGEMYRKYGLELPAAFKAETSPAKTKLRAAIDNFLKRLQAIVMKAFGYKVSDAQVRELLEGAWRYVESGETAKPGTNGLGDETVELTEEQQKTPAFQKWFGDSKVVDKSGKPLVVYHATHAANFEAFKRKRDDIGIHFGTKGQASHLFEHRRKFQRDNVPAPSKRAPRTIPAYLSIKNPLRLEDLGEWNWQHVIDSIEDTHPDFFKGVPHPLAFQTTSTLRQYLQERGYDGIVYSNRYEFEGMAELTKKREAAEDAVAAAERTELGKQGSDYAIAKRAQLKIEDEYQAKRAEGEAASIDSWIAFEPSQIKSAIGNTGGFDAGETDIALSEVEPESALLRKRAKKLDEDVARERQKTPSKERSERILKMIAQSVKLANQADEIDFGKPKPYAGAGAFHPDGPRSGGREVPREEFMGRHEARETPAPEQPEKRGADVENLLEDTGERTKARDAIDKQIRAKMAEVEHYNDLYHGMPEFTAEHEAALERIADEYQELQDRREEMFGERLEVDEPLVLSESDDEKPEASSKPQAAKGGAGKRYVRMYAEKGAPVSPTRSAVRSGAIDLPTTPVRREHVMKLFQHLFNVKIYEGKPFALRSALGYFRPSNYEIRNKYRNDLEVAAHEVFHWLDRTYPTLRALYHKRRFADELYGVSYDDTKIFEGFAEFGRLFLTQEPEAVTRLPTFYEAFVRETKELGILPKLERVQKLMHQWYLQGAEYRGRSKIGSEKAPIRQRLELMANGWSDRAIASSLDALQAAKVIERETTGGIADDAAMSPYKSMRLLAGARSSVNTWLNHGTLAWTPKGDMRINGKGLRQIFEPIADVFDETMGYFVAMRANELRKYSKEKLFTPDEIAALHERAKKTGKLEQIKTAHAEYQQYAKRLTAFAVQSGILSPESKATWEAMYQNYVPFFRVAEKFGSLDPRMTGATRGGLFRKLTGGTANVNDIFENMALNTATIVHASLKNVAKAQLFATIEKSKLGQRYAVKIPAGTEVRKVAMEQIESVLKGFAKEAERAMRNAAGQNQPGAAMEYAQLAQLASALGNRSNDLGQATMSDVQDQATFFFTGKPPSIPDKEQVLVRGKARWYQIGDPLLWDMLVHLNYHQPVTFTEQLFGVAKRTLTRGVTISPEFQIANLVRDTFNAFAMSKGKQWPVVDALKAMRDIWSESDAYKLFLANGGGFGNATGDEAKKVRVMMKAHGVKGVLQTPAALIEMWDKWGQSFELATRLAEFKKVAAQGKSLREAAFQGREVSTDFAMRGNSAAARWASISLAFFNARLQGLFRLERELFEKKGRQSWTGERQLAYATRAMMGITIPSLIVYLLFNKGDDDYDDLGEELKSLNTVIPDPAGGGVYLIPRPFETGALFQEIPIRLWEYYEKRDGEKLARAAKFMLLNTFNFNPVPQVAAPLATIATNTQWNGLPVVPRNLENVEPREQFQPWTPDTYKKIGEQFGVSPLKLQALVEGYFGTTALYAIAASDALVTSNGDLPEKKASQYPLLRRFMRQQPYANTQYEERFYEMLEEVTQVVDTARKLRREGRGDDLEQYLSQQDKAVLFAFGGAPGGQSRNRPATGAKFNISEEQQRAADMNAQIRKIRNDPQLTPEQKTKQIDDIQAQENELFKEVVKELDAAKLQQYRDALGGDIPPVRVPR